MDNPHAPEVFSTGPVGFFFNEGNITVTFASHRVNHVTTPGPVNRVVIGRLVMTAAAWRELTVEIYNILQQRGDAPKPPGDKLQ
jgi:hypothetical protein